MRKVALRLAALLFALAVMPLLPAETSAETVTIAHSPGSVTGRSTSPAIRAASSITGSMSISTADPKERFPTLMADRIQMIASAVDAALLYMKKPTDLR